MLAAQVVADHAVDQGVGFNQRRVAAWIGAALYSQVGRNHRERGGAQRLHQELQPVIEFVIAQCDRIEIERVHRGNDGMHITVPQSAFMRDEIAHRGALQEIAIVKKQGVGRLGAAGRNNRSARFRAGRRVALRTSRQRNRD